MFCVQGSPEKARSRVARGSTFAFVPLIIDVMKSSKVRQGELSKLSGIQQCTLSRYLRGEREMNLGVIFHLAQVLNIDQLRAYVAVFELNDWRLYYDDRLKTAIEFHQAVIAECMKLTALSVSPAETKVLAVQSVQSLVERKNLLVTAPSGRPAMFFSGETAKQQMQY